MASRDEDFGADLALIDGDDGISSSSAPAREARATGGPCTSRNMPARSGSARARTRPKRAAKSCAERRVGRPRQGGFPEVAG